MKGLTIIGIIGFFIAISIFIFQSYVGGIVENLMIGTTGEIIKSSAMDETSKQGINGALMLLGVAGTLAFVGGLIAIFKKFF